MALRHFTVNTASRTHLQPIVIATARVQQQPMAIPTTRVQQQPMAIPTTRVQQQPMAIPTTRVQQQPMAIATERNICRLEGVHIPDRYVWDVSNVGGTFADQDRTNVSVHKDFQRPIICNDTHIRTAAAKKVESLPTLDFTTGRRELVEQIKSAAVEWGFFQVVNHGVPESVADEMLSSGREFFQTLPVEVKELAVETNPSKHTYYHGYGGRFQHLQARVPWLEYLGESHHPMDGTADLLNKLSTNYDVHRLRNAIEMYSKELVKLGRQILELLAEGLDLPQDYFSQHFQESKAYQAHWRFNHYPACPEPSKTLGLGPHTDPCALTIVKEDDVGGFQIMKEGRWLDVQPLKEAFLVNIGDCLQAWTNGHLQSVLHRVLANKTSDRLSVVFPFSPPSDHHIQIPPPLVDEHHPLKYPSPIEWHHLAVVKGNHVKSDKLSRNFGLEEKRLASQH